VTLTPVEIARLLGRRDLPTPEQQAVITAPLRPGVVIAGAGSGKTETMAARVVWLVANAHVQPHEVLGLTFTRKAAGELAQRVRRRLQALADATGASDLAGEPTVSTYDAFAARVVAEHGARLGLEPDRWLLTPAASWQRAARLVARWDGDMGEVEYAPDTVVADVLDLHEQAAGHLASLDDVAGLSAAVRQAIETLPPGRKQRLAVAGDLRTPLKAQRARLQLLALVRAYRDALRRDEAADFATIAADAAQLALTDAGVGQALRAQFRVVLLDEYQDTSHAQLALLHAVFGSGHALTAVGDPFQSIYGWRGANADTLASFAQRFGDAGPVDERTLRTSFRNAHLVLQVANAVAEPLRGGPVEVPTLVAAPDAPAGVVRVALHRTAADEAEALAARLDALWRGREPVPGRSGDAEGPPQVAVLARKRDQIPLLEAALRARDLPVEVVGLDGLLTLPEVADVVALLRLLADPSRGDAFMRLLTGPLLAFGPRDLDALARWARTLAVPDPQLAQWQQQRPGIVEVLDHLPPSGRLSEPAAARLRTFAGSVTRLRARLARPVTDVVADAVRVLRLDVETRSRAARTGGVGGAHLDRLVDEAAAFAQAAPAAGIVEFVAYLAAAEQQERGLRRAAEVHLGSRLQVATVHAAKGLEWDVVAVAGLCEGVFPPRSRTGGAWLSDPGTLPYPLRGDAARLPHLSLEGLADQSDLCSRVTALKQQGREIELQEERRLAYVAVTRSRHVLLCSGYRWGDGVSAREPSPFLRQVAEVPGVVVDHWVDEPGEAPDATVDPPVWPHDVLGRHRGAVESGAALVRAALDAPEVSPPAPVAGSARAAEWAREVDLLLAERAAARRRPAVPPPTHLSASALVAATRDPHRWAEQQRRPMPSAPRPAARQGTAFHAWVEQLYGDPQLLDLDELPGAADAASDVVDDDLAVLQAAFRQSGWAERTPREVEAPFEMVVDGVVLRGRADAVFDDGDGLLVVDWKTGPPPRDEAELAARSVQLAVYRLAFAALHGRPVAQVRAAFHHVREQRSLTGDGLADEATLRALVRAAVATG
jgi:DNA helicase-2/ATP-dependent DNA helicase PcrA